MSARNVECRAMDADELDFTPQAGEALNRADVRRCFRATDVADRALTSGIDAAVNLASGWHGTSRVAFVCAHMLVSAIAYAADRLAEGRADMHGQKTTHT